MVLLDKPELVVIAGPNGAGKSTLSQTAYPSLIEHTVFINPDEIMAQLKERYPQKPETELQVKAAREALMAYEDCFQKRQSFSLETTLAGLRPLKTIETAKVKGFHVTLAFVGIESPEDSIFRVQRRVQLGGHNVPIPDILRRYERSLENLPKAIQVCDDILIFDNSQSTHQLLIYLTKGGKVRELYETMLPSWLTQRLVEPQLSPGQYLKFQNHLDGLALKPETQNLITDILHQNLELERLVRLKHIHGVSQPELAHRYRDEALKIDHHLQELIQKAFQCEDLKVYLNSEEVYCKTPLTLEQLQNLKYQMDQGIWLKSHIRLLCNYLQERSNNYAKSLSSDCNRSI